jgi:hypothetical protein
MRQAKFVWKDGAKGAQASFTIPLVGEVSLEVEADLPATGAKQTREQRKALAMRHARLLVRNLVNELDRQPL